MTLGPKWICPLSNTHFRYNLNGTDLLMFADGANHASKFDGTTVTDITTTGAPSDPAFVTRFKDTSFFAGMSGEPQSLVFTAPFTDDDFTPANGAGTIRVDSDITGLFPFRDALFIFCEERIFKLVGNTIGDFVVQPVTREIGCLNKPLIIYLIQFSKYLSLLYFLIFLIQFLFL